MKKFNYGFEDFSFSEDKANHLSEIKLLIKKLRGFKYVTPYLDVGVNMLYRITILEGYLLRSIIFTDRGDLYNSIKDAIDLCKDISTLLVNNSNVYTYHSFYNKNKRISDILFEKVELVDRKTITEAQSILAIDDKDMRDFINRFQSRAFICIEKIDEATHVIVLLNSFYSYMYLIENMDKKEINNSSFSLETANSISVENEIILFKGE